MPLVPWKMQILLREVMFCAVGPLLLNMKEESVNRINQSAREEEEEKQDMKNPNHKFYW